MSLGYPSVRPNPQGVQPIELPAGPHGVPDVMLHGLRNVRSETTAVHPLEYSEKHWKENKEKMDLAMLRNTQGLHGPLRLTMELNVAKQMQRLPGLPSSNIMLNTLTGRDEMIGFEDILNSPAESEMVGQPHILMEKRLNIL
ncbi:hypothetical protein ScPMuIL_009941 [Solemya velum]